jgi:hypothetical protein
MDLPLKVHGAQGLSVYRGVGTPLLYRSFFASFQHRVNGAGITDHGGRLRPLQRYSCLHPGEWRPQKAVCAQVHEGSMLPGLVESLPRIRMDNGGY